MDKSGNGTLRILKKKEEKKRTNAFYTGQKKVDRVQMRRHERLRGNLGTKQQLDDAPYVPLTIIHYFSPSCTCVHPMDFQSSTWQNNK